MGTLTFLFESLYAIRNNLLQQQKLLVNCHGAAVTPSQPTASFRMVLSSVPVELTGRRQQCVRWIDWMAPLFLTGGVYTGSRGQTKPFASKYSIFFGPGPSLSCFSILPRSNTNTSESHFSMTFFFLTQICIFHGSHSVLEIELHAQLIWFSG